MNIAKGKRGTELLITTLGVEPQVVTITVDSLLALECPVSEVTVIYTVDPRVLQALAIIEAEFSGGHYPRILLRAVPVEGPTGLISDFRDDQDLRYLRRTLYREVRLARQASTVVHLCVSGGRKVMGISAMVVAQLLFGPEDRVWHLVTEGWQPGNERRLHLPPEEPVWLVGVPVLRWTEAGTLLQAMADLDDPDAVLSWQEKISRSTKMRRRREFIQRWLSRAEREVVELACLGLDNATIARRLHKGEQTVANQLSEVYAKLKEWLGFPPVTVDRSLLIAEFAPYYALREEEI
ncbi:MAG: CRISPR-associated ring nuclease [Bacillota bacterium]